MALFIDVASALAQGHTVRRKRWNMATTMYVNSNNDLVCKNGQCREYEYQLSWYELTANDWQVQA